jgi:integrase
MAKRRAHGEGSVFQRSEDGRWVAVVDLGYENGKRSRKYVYGATQAEVVAKKGELLTQRAKGLPVARGKGVTVADFMAEWLDVMGKAESTAKTYRGHVRNHITPALGNIKLEKLEPVTVQRFIDNLPAKGISKATVVRIRATLSVAMNRAVDLGLIAYNPVTRAKAPRPPAGKTRHKPMETEDLKLFLKHAKAHRLSVVSPGPGGRLVSSPTGPSLWPLWALLAGTGLRMGEALALRWEDVGSTAVHVREGKSDTSTRTVPLPDWAAEALEGHQEATGDKRGLVFRTSTGRPLDKRNVNRWYHALLEAAGIADRRPHDLRHTYATRQVDEGTDLVTVSELLGHASITITAQYYVSGSSRAKTDAARRFDGLID